MSRFSRRRRVDLLWQPGSIFSGRSKLPALNSSVWLAYCCAILHVRRLTLPKACGEKELPIYGKHGTCCHLPIYLVRRADLTLDFFVLCVTILRAAAEIETVAKPL
jgi:hypothetical protein